MPIIVNGVSGTFWGSGKRKAITLTAGMIAAILGAYSQIKANADDLEHFIPCSWPCARSYADLAAKAEAKRVAEDIEAKLKKYQMAQTQVERTTYAIRRELADGKREQAEDNLFKAGRDLKAAQHAMDTEADPKTKQFIEGQVDDLTKQINRLQATISKIDKATEAITAPKSSD